MKILQVSLKAPSKLGAAKALFLAMLTWSLLMLSPLRAQTERDAVLSFAAVLMGSLMGEVGLHIHKGWRHWLLSGCAMVPVLLLVWSATNLFMV